MANTPATGNGPFEFTSAGGKQISIPLGAFSFDSSGKAVVDPAWSSLTDVPPGKTLLALAIQNQTIMPRPTPSPFPAIIVRAADPGAGGNNISVAITVSNVVTSPPSNDPTLVPFSIEIQETDSYSGLTMATVESVLGSDTVAGSLPGLVRVVHSSLDSAAVATHCTGNLAGTPAVFSVTAEGSPPVAFVLSAKKSGADGTLTQVTVTPDISSPSSPGTPTFSLQAMWSKTVSGITLPQLDAMASALGYEITVSRPSSGAYSVPADSTSMLSGGAAGTVASATLYTSQ
jgi:hypothetical protein